MEERQPVFLRLFKISVCQIALAVLFFCQVLAANFDQKIISDIRVQGNQTIAGEDILSWLKVKTGTEVQDATIVVHHDLKNLWDTGKFENISFSLIPLSDGTVRLLLAVQEKPLLLKIHFKGNQAFNEKKLLEESGLAERIPYDSFAVDTAIKKIENFYKEKEYYQAVVTQEVQQQDGGVVLSLDVHEGTKVKITKIKVTGNQAFSEGKIKGVMETKEAGWFVGGIYKEETFIEDLKKVLWYYSMEGYLKAKLFGFGLQDLDLKRQEIIRRALYVDEIKKEMTITLEVTEGIQYRVAEVSIKGNIIYSEEELLNRMELKKEAILNRLTFEKDLHSIRLAYSEKGYIFADVSPEMEYNDDDGAVLITVIVREGTIARVERVDIRGNTITKDKVVRREIVVKPGEPFDSRKIERSREKITNLGFFQDVKVNTEPGSSPSEQVLVFEVDERHTGTISLGAGYSSVDYLMGYLQLTQANLFGNGQSVSLQWELGSLRQSWQMSFTEPWLFDSPVSFGVDVWNINKHRGYAGQSYDLLSQGGDIRLGRRFTDQWKGYLTYKLESNEYSNLDSSVADVFAEGRSDTSSVIPTLIYDSRDNIFDPSKGQYQRLSVEIAGGILGGDNNYLKYNFDTTYYLPLIWKIVLALHGETGYAHGFEFGVTGFTDVPPNERYRLGGTDSVRGYGEGDFGSDLPGGGGRFKIGSNVELHFPIIGPLKGVAFFDAGNVWSGIERGDNLDPDDKFFLDYPSLYKGAGVGFRLTVPGTVILIRFDFGYPLDSDPDGTPPSLQYHFNIGNIF
ncbi:outer membrane protein assembly factor BamA [candidate division FCPU426 bacterium]|nr:outer membrane protein assembly factor BamA [candidate division FCPU426 bacterium]